MILFQYFSKIDLIDKKIYFAKSSIEGVSYLSFQRSDIFCKFQPFKFLIEEMILENKNK